MPDAIEFPHAPLFAVGGGDGGSSKNKRELDTAKQSEITSQNENRVTSKHFELSKRNFQRYSSLENADLIKNVSLYLFRVLWCMETAGDVRLHMRRSRVGRLTVMGWSPHLNINVAVVYLVGFLFLFLLIATKIKCKFSHEFFGIITRKNDHSSSDM